VRIHEVVGGTVLHLLSKTDCLHLLLRTVVSWSDDHR
jgi:hypothetical protein